MKKWSPYCSSLLTQQGTSVQTMDTHILKLKAHPCIFMHLLAGELMKYSHTGIWVCAHGRSEWKSSFKYNFSFLIKTHHISQLQQFFNIFPQIKPSPRLQHHTSDWLWISKIIWERQMIVRKSLRELLSINVSVASRKVCLKSLMNHACDFSIKSQVGHRLRETTL